MYKHPKQVVHISFLPYRYIKIMITYLGRWEKVILECRKELDGPNCATKLSHCFSCWTRHNFNVFKGYEWPDSYCHPYILSFSVRHLCWLASTMIREVNYCRKMFSSPSTERIDPSDQQIQWPACHAKSGRNLETFQVVKPVKKRDKEILCGNRG